MGADLKSAFVLASGAYAYISPYFGNLENYPVQQRYEATIRKYVSLFGAVPKVVLADAHPQYQSHQLGKALAAEWGVAFKTLAHHEAHFYSVLAENDLLKSPDNVLGVIWDGTGLGTDGAIWGGEFFSYTAKAGSIRTNHFAYFPWLSNDKMAREPKLSLLSLSEDSTDELKQRFSDTELRLYLQLRQRATVQTSSVGRLFDALGSLLGCGDRNTFERQTALYLETLARKNTEAATDLLGSIEYEHPSGAEIIRQLRKRKASGQSSESLAASFHLTLAKVILREAERQNTPQVACSGGVFQNAVLVELLRRTAQKQNIQIYFNQELSPNDENIAFGQLHWWLNRLR